MAPRALRRRIGPLAAGRTTLSSTRAVISRSCSRNPSATSPSRARASSLPATIGSSLRLALVMTSGRPTQLEEQQVQRRRRKQEPRRWRVLGPPRARTASFTRRNQHHRPFGGTQQRSPRPALSTAERAGVLDAAHHNGERLRLASLPCAQSPHCGVVGGIDARDGTRPCPVIATIRPARSHEPAAASAENADMAGSRLRSQPSPRSGPQPRSAGRTTVRLGVIAAVAWCRVLAGRSRAQRRKCAHAGARAIVWQPLDHGVPRAAVGAGDERVHVAPVARIVELRRHASHSATSAGTAGVAAGSSRLSRMAKSYPPHGVIGSTCTSWIRASGGASVRSSAANCSRCPWRALDLDFDRPRRIANPARERMAAREPVHERAEAHALHHAGHSQVTGGARSRSPAGHAGPGRRDPLAQKTVPCVHTRRR